MYSVPSNSLNDTATSGVRAHTTVHQAVATGLRRFVWTHAERSEPACHYRPVNLSPYCPSPYCLVPQWTPAWLQANPTVINVFSTTPTTAGVVRSTFSMFGLPEELVLNNGPQFRSSAFADFLAQHTIQHRRTPPLWPQANRAVERLNRTIGKVLQTAKLAGEDINVALDQWLLAYRTTPHPATHEAPATLMFGRPTRGSIPCITPAAPDLPSAANSDQRFRQSQRDAANATRWSNAPILTPGQRVLRRNEQAHSKLSPQ